MFARNDQNKGWAPRRERSPNIVSGSEQEVTIFGVEGGSYQLMLAWLPSCIFKLLNIDETSKVSQFH